MMNPAWNTTLMTVIFSLPVVTSLICAMIVTIYGREERNLPHALIRTLVAAFLVSTFLWGCIVLYLQWPILFVVLQTAFYYALLILHVLLYRVTYSLTGTGGKECFSNMHYIVPAIIPAVLLIWSFYVPLDAQLYIVTSRGQAMAGYEAYTALFTSKPIGLLLWNITYNLLSFRRIMAYRHVIGNYSADEGRSPVRWIKQMILVLLSIIMYPLIAMGMGRTVLFGSLWMILPSILIVAELIILCYNIVSENYIVITDADEKTDTDRDKAHHINREYFEHYIQTQKPYLNPKLRITDVAADLHSNRTYVSNFINSEYGMNFSRYINLQRLKELDLLCLDPKNKIVMGIDLIFQAGFSTYRGYIRTKTEEDRNRLLKGFEDR
ncbi:hypothetical protein [Bacteroides sp. UBA939]|uniref:hypothetical protein n=1 Tax=Bacteroides sp. UBA939 TaxID=1946092 RepID=UPI0025B8FF16|nr:hypothetical protein [Bacteroides sp. UBA939]